MNVICIMFRLRLKHLRYPTPPPPTPPPLSDRTTMASSGFWQVYLSGHWKNFTPEENALIASAAKSNQNILRLYTRGLGWYEIDISLGLQTNVKTKKTRKIRPPQATPVGVDAQALGLEVHRRVSAGGLQSPDDRLRWGVRDETRRIALRYHKACENLVQAENWDDKLAQDVLGSGAAPVGLGEVLREQVRLYVSTRSAGTCGEGGKNPRGLLGRFDVLRVPCVLDFDAAWTRTTATTAVKEPRMMIVAPTGPPWPICSQKVGVLTRRERI